MIPYDYDYSSSTTAYNVLKYQWGGGTQSVTGRGDPYFDRKSGGNQGIPQIPLLQGATT